MTMGACHLKTRFDAHCHLSFAPYPERIASWVAQRYAGAFSTTVSPADFVRTQQLLEPWDSLKVGFGAHPWWVSSGDVGMHDIDASSDDILRARYIGEVGLDFGKKGIARSIFVSEEETKAAQVQVLRAILAICAREAVCEHGRKSQRVFSFHAVQSADVMLDLLQEYKLLTDNVAIFHWFSGSSAQLQRARELGCCFSVNASMLNTKRGREYAKAIPAGQLFVETDLPEERQKEESADSFDVTCVQYATALDSAYEQLVALRGPDILSAIEQNTRRVFG